MKKGKQRVREGRTREGTDGVNASARNVHVHAGTILERRSSLRQRNEGREGGGNRDRVSDGAAASGRRQLGWGWGMGTGNDKGEAARTYEHDGASLCACAARWEDGWGWVGTTSRRTNESSGMKRLEQGGSGVERGREGEDGKKVTHKLEEGTTARAIARMKAGRGTTS
ncbi:hypothetical protein BDN71DRAFT_1437240 [Pleurotus eryngii]|uniref:Uncharacterized protein n=1 Tax=Pleurotus eryngii TaxID=5323 RepID=A0A9P5ZJB4_PLEER|nr:hypothetical protein BDN71DRAFT_1437240 [Pleurotus eryngii]